MRYTANLSVDVKSASLLHAQIVDAAMDAGMTEDDAYAKWGSYLRPNVAECIRTALEIKLSGAEVGNVSLRRHHGNGVTEAL